MEQEATPHDLFSVAAFAERHRTWTTQAALRSHIFNAVPRLNSRGEEIPSNGLAQTGAIIRLGRRLYLSESRFFRWLSDQQQPRATRKAAA